MHAQYFCKEAEFNTDAFFYEDAIFPSHLVLERKKGPFTAYIPSLRNCLEGIFCLRDLEVEFHSGNLGFDCHSTLLNLRK
jgi:hypothetical protein